MVTKKALLKLYEWELDRLIEAMGIVLLKKNMTKEEKILVVLNNPDRADEAMQRLGFVENS